MSNGARRALGIALAVLVTLAIAALSRLPYDATTGEQALIRLSWRTTGEYVEECRRLTQEELERLPVHMRREEVCEGRLVPYRLSVLLDGRPVVEETVQPAGARRDRPLYVFRELPVAPGEYRLEVRWERADLAAGGSPLSLDAALQLQAREIALITYDSDARRLVARGAGIPRSNTTR